jgi:putative membrane protein
MRLVALWLLNALSIIVVAHVLPSVQVESFWTALLVALLLGLVNVFVRPLLILLTLPAVVLTMGLFLLVINAIGLWLVDLLVEGFHIVTFGSTLLAALLISVLSALGRWLLRL